MLRTPGPPPCGHKADSLEVGAREAVQHQAEGDHHTEGKELGHAVEAVVVPAQSADVVRLAGHKRNTTLCFAQHNGGSLASGRGTN